MEGFLDLRIRPWVRRIITRLIAVVPAVCVAIWVGAKGLGQFLILSQVILSFQLAFAVVPLVIFTSDKELMGRFTNSFWIKVAAWAAAVMIIGLNLFLIGQVVTHV
jgi:manganese transport protein